MAVSETFGAELRRLREEAGLKQRDLASAAGTDATYLSRLESGTWIAGKRMERALAAALDVAWQNTQHLRELAFLARGECCPRCGFGGEE